MNLRTLPLAILCDRLRERCGVAEQIEAARRLEEMQNEIEDLRSEVGNDDDDS